MASDASPRFPQAEPGLVYDLAKSRLEMQIAQLDVLDTKIANTLGFASALLIVVAAFLALNENHLPPAAIALFAVASATYFLLTIALLCAYFVQKWEVGPPLNDAWTYADRYAPAVLRWWAAESFVSCYTHNKAKIIWKGRAAKLGAALVVLETAASVAGLAVVALA